MATDQRARQDFGSRLRAFRTARSLSTYALARALSDRGHNRSPQSVSLWETGANSPPATIVACLEDILDAPGELLPALGLAVPGDRLAILEAEVVALRQDVARLLAQVRRETDGS